MQNLLGPNLQFKLFFTVSDARLEIYFIPQNTFKLLPKALLLDFWKSIQRNHIIKVKTDSWNFIFKKKFNKKFLRREEAHENTRFFFTFPLPNIIQLTWVNHLRDIWIAKFEIRASERRVGCIQTMFRLCFIQ